MESTLIQELKQEKIELKEVAEKLNMQRSVISNVLNEDLRRRVEGAVLELLLEKRGRTEKIISKLEGKKNGK